MAASVKWGEPFITEVTFPAMYKIVSWGSGVSGWNDGFAHFNCVQNGRGIGTNLGYAGNSDTANYPVAIPFSLFGMSPASSGFGTGFAYNRGGSGAMQVLCEFGEVDGLKKHFDLRVEASTNKLQIANGTAGTIVADSGLYTYPVTNYSHIEIIPVIGDSGSVQVWVDSVLRINASGIDIRNLGAGTVGIIQYLFTAGQPITDLYITDGAARYGDKRVSYFETTADGSLTDGSLVAVGAATKHEAVDEVSSNGDTDYVEFDDTFLPKAYSTTTRALPANVRSVGAVMPYAVVRKDDGGIDIVRSGLVSGGSSYETADVPSQTGYILVPAEFVELDPNTGIAWTNAGADAAEPYLKRTA